MKNRKWLALSLATCMTMSVLSACGQAETKESSASKEQESKSEAASSEVKAEDTGITFPLEKAMSFTGFTDVPGTGVSLEDTVGWQEFKKYAGDNLTVEFIEAPFAEASEKAQLLLGSGDYPDFFYRTVPDPEIYGVQEEIYIPLEDLIREYMPNYTALLDKNNGWNDLKSSDGNIYTIGSVQGINNCDWPLWINATWLENVGMQMPTNMEELYQVSKAFKEQDANGNGDPNDEIPCAFSAQDFSINCFLYYLDEGTMIRNEYTYIKDGEKHFYPFTEGFKEDYLRWFKRMWDEELMDHNSFTQTNDQLKAVTSVGDVTGWHFAYVAGLITPFESRSDYRAMMPVENENPLTVYSRIFDKGLAITDKCENPGVILAWYDWRYTEEGAMTVQMGIEGEHYIYNKDGSVKFIGEDLGKVTTNSNSDIYLVTPAQVILSEETDPVTVQAENDRRQLADKYGICYPKVLYTPEEMEVINRVKPDLFSYIETYAAETITGVKDLDATWDEFQSTMKAMGAEELEAAYNAAFKRANQ